MKANHSLTMDQLTLIKGKAIISMSKNESKSQQVENLEAKEDG